MIDNIIAEEKYINSCFTLSVDDIKKFDAEDNGPINNVLIGIAIECFGVRLFDDAYGVTVEMYYINGKNGLKGDIIQLDVRDKDYYKLLLRFCVMLANNYEDVDALITLNTFQLKLRGFLEKRQFVTISNLELKKFDKKSALLMSANERGMLVIDFIDHKEFYEDFFGNISSQIVQKGREYVYLMVNCDTGLIKIGFSNNPVYRERTLHSQEPSIHRIAMWCCEKSVEKELHKLFAAKRVRGEWFRLSIQDLIRVENFMKKYLST